MNLSDKQMRICTKGDFKKILSIIKQGYNKNDIFKCMCQFGHLEVVKYLIETCGANARDNSDFAIRYACLYNHLEVVKYLVEKCGADARVCNIEIIEQICIFGYLEVVKYLVEKCEVNVIDDNDCTVRMASWNGHFELVKYLIDKCGAVLSEINPKYERYLIVYEKGERRRKCIMAKKIYFWWVQACYNPNTLTGQRSMYKGYREYLSIR